MVDDLAAAAPEASPRELPRPARSARVEAPRRSRRAIAPALLAAALWVSAAAAQQGPPPVTVASPVVKEIVEDDEFVGRFEAVAEVEVRARVTGYLEEARFRDGQTVEAGQPLFSVDAAPFRTALRQAEALFRVAQASFDYAGEQFDRAANLIENGTISQATLDERREAFLGAQAELESARAAVERAEIDLGYTEIRAPIAGRIGADLVKPGNLVRENETVLTEIVALDPIRFTFDIDERYALAYARVARARGVSLQEGGGGLPVRVTLSDGSAHEGRLDFAESRLDAETGTMRVRAALANPEGVLHPGLFGRVNVPGSLPYEGVLIPDEAVVADQNRRLVMLVNGENQVVPREIRPGPRIDGYRVVREGLDGTETLVIEGLVQARPGASVSPERVELPPVAEGS
jgi:RND family efflux transporter MFP subunit